MITKQVYFRSEGEDAYIGGILCMEKEDDLKNAFIICGCCGGIIEIDEVEEMEIYPTWVGFSDEIML